MGGEHSDTGETFRREDWEEVERGELANTWQNRRDPTQRIVEYRLHLASKEDCRREEEVYYLRKNHPQLVAALYLCSESNSDFCSSTYQQQLFLEKTPITLTDIEHIPYPDFLHLYSQALRGYSELAQHFGSFTVEQDYIGVNERGVAKIWLNADFASHHVAGKASQQDMVRSIVDIIERNIDQSHLPQRVPSVRSYLYRNNLKLQFAEAIAELNNFIRQFSNGYVPQKLECIDRVGGIYAIANRDKSLQASPSSIQQYPLPNQFPVQYGIPNEAQRPIFAQSNIVTTQFRQSAPRVQSSPVYITNPPNTSYQNDERSVLTPSTVRQNVPVVRKQTPVWYNGAPEQQNYELRRTAPAFAILQPAQQVFVPEPVNMKVGSRGNDPKVGQNFGNTPVPNGIQSAVVLQQEQLANDSPNNIANRLYNQFTHEVMPTIAPPAEPQLPNLQFFQQAQAQTSQVQSQSALNKQPTLPNFQSFQATQPSINGFASNPLPNQIFNPIQAYSTVSVNSNGPSSRVVSNVQQNQQAPSSMDYGLNALNVARNQVAPIITMPADNLPKLDQFNFSKSNQVQYAVDVNDGKSSLDFFKKLNEMNNFSNNYTQSNQQISQSFGNIEPPKEEYYNPFGYTSSSVSRQQQEFGRNAVSKIVSHQVSYQVGAERKSEPLRFQNNVQMKYSIFEESAPTYTYNSYAASYEPEASSQRRE